MSIPLVNFTREAGNPVIGLGAGGSGYEGRILTPSVKKLGASSYKAWWSGIPTNGGGLNQGWNIFSGTSANKTSWTPTGVAVAGAWEVSVEQVGSDLYMAHVLDSGYGIRLRKSTDNGATWSAPVLILSAFPWGDATNGPREPYLFYDSASLTLHLYGTDHPADGSSNETIGVARCTGDPMVPANWEIKSTPAFSPTIASPRWNQGGYTESPAVFKLDGLAHPYVMLFTAFNNLATVTNLCWRLGAAVADSPWGPFVEAKNNPILTIGQNGQWDDRIVAEACPLIEGDTASFFYSGGKVNGINQIGLATMTVAQLQAMLG